MIKIVLDAMGGDNAPEAILNGAIKALSENADVFIYAVGQEEKINACLKDKTYPADRMNIVNASEVISASDHPTEAIRKKKDSSLVVGMKLLKEGRADAFVSAGNSGAILVGGQVIVGRIKGIERAPFAPMVPVKGGVCLLLDCGANVDPRPAMLVQFAKMGSIYMQHAMNISSPTVALLNNGAEEGKGNALTKEAYSLLAACKDINFTGNIESRDLPFAAADVVVCDAFTGNAVLKMYEGTSRMLLSTLKEAMMSDLRSKIGAMLLKPAIKKAMQEYDGSKYGGAMMLGLNGLVVKTHGNAKETEICNAIHQCIDFARQDINAKIRSATSVEGEI